MYLTYDEVTKNKESKYKNYKLVPASNQHAAFRLRNSRGLSRPVLLELDVQNQVFIPDEETFELKGIYTLNSIKPRFIGRMEGVNLDTQLTFSIRDMIITDQNRSLELHQFNHASCIFISIASPLDQQSIPELPPSRKAVNPQSMFGSPKRIEVTYRNVSQVIHLNPEDDLVEKIASKFKLRPDRISLYHNETPLNKLDYLPQKISIKTRTKWNYNGLHEPDRDLLRLFTNSPSAFTENSKFVLVYSICKGVPISGDNLFMESFVNPKLMYATTSLPHAIKSWIFRAKKGELSESTTCKVMLMKKEDFNNLTELEGDAPRWGELVTLYSNNNRIIPHTLLQTFSISASGTISYSNPNHSKEIIECLRSTSNYNELKTSIVEAIQAEINPPSLADVASPEDTSSFENYGEMVISLTVKDNLPEEEDDENDKEYADIARSTTFLSLGLLLAIVYKTPSRLARPKGEQDFNSAFLKQDDPILDGLKEISANQANHYVCDILHLSQPFFLLARFLNEFDARLLSAQAKPYPVRRYILGLLLEEIKALYQQLDPQTIPDLARDFDAYLKKLEINLQEETSLEWVTNLTLENFQVNKSQLVQRPIKQSNRRTIYFDLEAFFNSHGGTQLAIRPNTERDLVIRQINLEEEKYYEIIPNALILINKLKNMAAGSNYTIVGFSEGETPIYKDFKSSDCLSISMQPKLPSKLSSKDIMCELNSGSLDHLAQLIKKLEILKLSDLLTAAKIAPTNQAVDVLIDSLNLENSSRLYNTLINYCSRTEVSFDEHLTDFLSQCGEDLLSWALLKRYSGNKMEKESLRKVMTSEESPLSGLLANTLPDYEHYRERLNEENRLPAYLLFMAMRSLLRLCYNSYGEEYKKGYDLMIEILEALIMTCSDKSEERRLSLIAKIGLEYFPENKISSLAVEKLGQAVLLATIAGKGSSSTPLVEILKSRIQMINGFKGAAQPLDALAFNREFIEQKEIREVEQGPSFSL